MQKIQTLTVRAFRGIRDTTIDFDSRSMILHGENGFGKSSLVDALEFIFTGSISHLDEARRTSTKRHASHIHFMNEDTRAILRIHNPDTVIERTFAGITCAPRNQTSFLQAGQNANFILRRKQLLDFIIARPAGRYEQIAQVIGVSELDDIELNLMRRRDELVEETEKVATQLESVERQLGDLLEVSYPTTDEKALNALNDKLSELGQQPLESFENIETHKLGAIKGTKDPKQIRLATRVKTLYELVKELSQGKAPLEDHGRLWESYDELHRNSQLIRDIAFHNVLESGKNLIEEFSLEACPLCEQTIQQEVILDRLENRLLSTAEARKISEEISRLKGRLRGDLEKRETLIRNLLKGLDELELELAITLQPASSYLNFLEELLQVIAAEPIKMSLRPLHHYLETDAIKEWNEFADKLSVILHECLNELSITDTDQLVLEAIELLSSFADLRQQINQLAKQKKVKAKIREQMSTAYELFVETKQEEIQAIYDVLQADIQHFYNTLHPGEEHGEIKLQIDSKKRSSTEILMDFHDRPNEDPRAYQSEAHLDSLGLCTFLAFVKHFNEDFPLIILDDVVSTVDAQHRRRVGDLLYKEFDDYQILITTHDDIWFDELVNCQRALNIGHRFHNIQILDWSLTDGLRLDRHKPRWDVLQERLNDRDKVSAAAHGRRNLEWILQVMATTTLTKVPIKPAGKYTVGDLYEPFKVRIRKLVPEEYEANENIFIQLEKDGVFGNLLVHNNLKAENASIEEVRAFTDAVKALYRLFTCENGQFIEYHQAAKIMKCRCNHIQWNTK